MIATTLCAPPGDVPENTRFLSGAIESGVRAGCVVHRAILASGAIADPTTMADPTPMRRAVLDFLHKQMSEDLKLSGLK